MRGVGLVYTEIQVPCNAGAPPFPDSAGFSERVAWTERAASASIGPLDALDVLRELPEVRRALVSSHIATSRWHVMRETASPRGVAWCVDGSKRFDVDFERRTYTEFAASARTSVAQTPNVEFSTSRAASPGDIAIMHCSSDVRDGGTRTVQGRPARKLTGSLRLDLRDHHGEYTTFRVVRDSVSIVDRSLNDLFAVAHAALRDNWDYRVLTRLIAGVRGSSAPAPRVTIERKGIAWPRSFDRCTRITIAMARSEAHSEGFEGTGFHFERGDMRDFDVDQDVRPPLPDDFRYVPVP